MKLYYSKGACSLAVRIVIHELGVASQFEGVDLHTKRTENGEDFLKINKKGAVPVLLTDDNKILTENAVIQQYLAEKHHALQLLPPNTDFNHYRVLEWLNFVSSDLHKTAGALFNPKLPEEVKNEIYKPLLKTKLDYINTALDKKTYLMGDQFTLPDAYLFVILRWVVYFNIDLNQYANLARYFDNMKKRKSVAQSLQEENLT